MFCRFPKLISFSESFGVTGSCASHKKSFRIKTTEFLKLKSYTRKVFWVGQEGRWVGRKLWVSSRTLNLTQLMKGGKKVYTWEVPCLVCTNCCLQTGLSEPELLPESEAAVCGIHTKPSGWFQGGLCDSLSCGVVAVENFSVGVVSDCTCIESVYTHNSVVSTIMVWINWNLSIFCSFL